MTTLDTVSGNVWLKTRFHLLVCRPVVLDPLLWAKPVLTETTVPETG